MSGGHFNYRQVDFAEMFVGEFRDTEIDALFVDLFGNGYDEGGSEFGRTWASRDGMGAGIVESLDLWLSGDISEDEYRSQVARFKNKWLRRDDGGRLEFYLGEFDRRCAEMKERFRREFLCEVTQDE